LGALPFTPINTILYRHFFEADLENVDVPQIIDGYEQSWSSLSNVLSTDNDYVWAIAFSPDGKQVASALMKQVRVWDVILGSMLLPPLKCDNKTPCSLVYSPDGQQIVCGAENDLYQWSVVSGKLIWGPLIGHANYVTSVVFSPDGQRVASGDLVGTIRVWDATSGYQVFELIQGHTDEIHSMVFTSDGKRIVTGASDWMVCLWSADRAADAISVLQGHEARVMAVASSPDGNWIVSGSKDGTVRVWDAIMGTEICLWQLGALPQHAAMAFSSNGSKFICENSDMVVRVWDVGLWNEGSDCGPTDKSIHVPFSPLTMAVSPDNMQFAVAGVTSVLLFDLTAGTQDGSAQYGHHKVSGAVAVSPDGSRVICGTGNIIHSWDVSSGKEILPRLIGHHGTILALAFSPDGSRIVSSADDKTICLWVGVSGKASLVWNVPKSGELDSLDQEQIVRSLAFSFQGTHIVACAYKVYIWDISSGTPIQVQCFNEVALWACFSSDGTIVIILPSLKSDVHLKELKSGAIVTTYRCVLKNCCNLINPIVVDEDGWIVDKATTAVVGKLPAIFEMQDWASSQNVVAFTTTSKNLHIMSLPYTALTSPGTWYRD
jgi:WD40 repeat protein